MSRPSPQTVLLLALLLAACGTEQSQPAPVIDAEQWGHLPPDPERPQQAQAPDRAAPDRAAPAKPA